MSWLLNLFETYKAHEGHVGTIERKQNEQEFTLLPVSHTTQNAHIEVEITEDGEFLTASVIEGDASTLIPCTEDSASRAGAKVAPYPLHDKLSYVAGDYVAYGGEIKKEVPFDAYIKQLAGWANSPHATAKVKSIYHYLRKGRLIQDLVAWKILYLDENNHLLDKWDKKAETFHGTTIRPSIFSVVAGDQESAFVRFNVSQETVTPKVWKDPEMYESFVRYYSGQLGDEDWCYVTGDKMPATDKHANKIRNAADKAKLISANDTSGFTFRGRFRDSRDAASISYEVSQKAHNALKWLINRQGKIIDQRVFLVWGNKQPDIPGVMDDFFTLALESSQESANTSQVFTKHEFAAEVNKALGGYRNQLADPKYVDREYNVNIMVLDSATTGRMAVLYYRNLDKHLYLDKLVEWHTTCMWLHRYRKNDNGEFIAFYGAPATKDIAFAAYGPRASDKVVKGLMERMLPCIVDGKPIPLDIVNSAFRRASSPESMERWDWEKTLSIACALINKREELEVALDESNDHRDYLFGRLLAVADVLERRSLGFEEKRASNAIRYMNAFSRHPERTWLTIQAALVPHQARLGTYANKLNQLIDEIGSQIPADQFNNRPLSGLYLLGFYSQRHELIPKKESNDAEEASN
ncbi:type I-C CRISPR-associated protein Cas8c/Csd1 [Paenibacillus cymbidii]|uniref:type I-C CRISPR-associated protein Cas8c/Csd1 n=1 Tax=Paenibacillus cymbidii TaxID=1639034 RepID=UPI001081B8D7|nr:type I-C CRISPR-associated protein Cas8c/Csd1 [Paenibacillus cymbidii]